MIHPQMAIIDKNDGEWYASVCFNLFRVLNLSSVQRFLFESQKRAHCAPKSLKFNVAPLYL